MGVVRRIGIRSGKGHVFFPPVLQAALRRGISEYNLFPHRLITGRILLFLTQGQSYFRSLSVHSTRLRWLASKPNSLLNDRTFSIFHAHAKLSRTGVCYRSTFNGVRGVSGRSNHIVCPNGLSVFTFL